MSFFEERIDPILRKTAARIEQSKALQSIVDGTMSDEQFKFYNIQDYQYLVFYLKAWGTALGKTTDYYEIKDILTIINDIFIGLDYCRDFWAKEVDASIDEMDRTVLCEGKTNYTSYLINIANTGDLASLFCAVFPCGKMYTYFAEDLMPKCKLDKENKYYKWLEYYTTDHYKQEAANKMALVNRYCEGKSEKELNKLEQIIATSCNYEILQWEDTYYNMTTWPIDDIFPKKMISID